MTFTQDVIDYLATVDHSGIGELREIGKKHGMTRNQVADAVIGLLNEGHINRKPVGNRFEYRLT